MVSRVIAPCCGRGCCGKGAMVLSLRTRCARGWAGSRLFDPAQFNQQVFIIIQEMEERRLITIGLVSDTGIMSKQRL